MTPTRASRRVVLAIGATRIGVGVFVVGVLVHTYVAGFALGQGNPFDYFGYFTNQTNLLGSALVATSGVLMLLGRPTPPWLSTARAVLTACLVVVAVVYNGLIPGTGSAPAWVSPVLHVWFPLFALLDWLIVGDRSPLRWQSLWLVLPYPLLWLAVVLVRGATDGWVPYGFLLPERGAASLLAHCAGMLVALVVAGPLVWAGSRPCGVLVPRTVTRGA